MKKFYLSSILIMAAAGICLAQTNSSARAGGRSSSTADSGKAISLNNMTAVDTQLQNTIDVKNAKVGDPVILKTTKAVKENGETIIPKGSSLIGRITEVKEGTKDNAGSKVGMIFDRIEGKNLSAPVAASIMSIVNTRSTAAVGDTLDSTMSNSSQSSASTSGGGGSSGGLLGGVGNTVGGVTNTVGGLTNTATQTLGGVTNTAGQTLGSATGTLGRTVNGIQISNAVSGSANSSTELSAPGKNLKIDKGVTFQMQLSNQGGSATQSGN